jgi:hypothetical protein
MLCIRSHTTRRGEMAVRGVPVAVSYRVGRGMLGDGARTPMAMRCDEEA